MIILAVDSSSKVATVALMKDDKITWRNYFK